MTVVSFVRSGPPTANKRVGARGQRAAQEMGNLFREAGGDFSDQHRYGVVYYFVRGIDPRMTLTPTTSASGSVSLLRERAVQHGARLRIVFVRPPREARIEVEGIESALEEALREHFPAELNDLSGHTIIEEISDVEIDAIEVRQHETVVEGEATVSVSLNNADETWATESFPFTFSIALDRNGRLKKVSRLEVDTSSWFGDGDDLSEAIDNLGKDNAGNDPDLEDL